MNQKQKNLQPYKRIFKFIETLIILAGVCAPFVFIWYVQINTIQFIPFTGKGNIFECLVYAAAALIFIRLYGGFDIGFYTPLNTILSQVLGLLITNFLMCIQIVLTLGDLYAIGHIMLWLFICNIIQIVISIVLVLIMESVYVRMFPAWNILLIYEKDSVRLFTDKLSTRKDKYVIGDMINVSEGFDAIAKKLENHEFVIVYDVASEIRNDIVKYCYGRDITVYQTPKISDILIRGAREYHMFDTPLIASDNVCMTFEQKFIKRFMDIIISLLMIIITSPVMLITALCIKAEDGGPVFFTQKRVTIGGREFVIYKFRSMIVDAESDGKAHPATNDDDRITKTGRFIRKTRIDELPQLINVLKGDMSLVGPRPERTEHVEKYCSEIPEFAYRTKVKGGLTGYAQVYGKYNTTAYDKLKLDLMYIENYSLALDLRIILMTVKVIFMNTSTEGFNENMNKDGVEK